MTNYFHQNISFLILVIRQFSFKHKYYVIHLITVLKQLIIHHPLSASCHWALRLPSPCTLYPIETSIKCCPCKHQQPFSIIIFTNFPIVNKLTISHLNVNHILNNYKTSLKQHLKSVMVAYQAMFTGTHAVIFTNKCANSLHNFRS